MKTKTKKAIDKLKRSWESDPCWDIEDTEGFEAHREELAKYRKEMEHKWDYERIMRIDAQAFKLECSFKTAKYTLALEDRIARLENTVEKLADRVEAYQARNTMR